MALGSSAPEILLSVIEIVFNNWEAGALGPSTIVGSAAFNLMVIIAVCVSSIPAPNDETGETGFRKIRQMGVFNVTAFFSVFAYLWLIVILQGNTAGVVDPWEAVVTFLFFFVLVLIAWMIDSGKCTGVIGGPKKQGGQLMAINIDQDGDGRASMVQFANKTVASNLMKKEREAGGYKGKDSEKLAAALTQRAFKEKKVSRAQYRVNANRRLQGGQRVIPEMKEIKNDEEEKKAETNGIFMFAAAKYQILESSRHVVLDVHLKRCVTGDEKTYKVKYKTGDPSDTATADQDYVSAEGTLTFEGKETAKEVKITIIQDDEEENDEVFTVRLFDASGPSGPETVKILKDMKEAKVTIIDDESKGQLGFAESKDEKDTTMRTIYRVKESDGDVAIKVVRTGGSSGEVSIHYKTEDGQKSNKAIAGMDYISTEGDLVFKQGEVEKVILVGVIDDEDFEKDEVFYVKLSNPTGCDIGEITSAKVIIENDDVLAGLGEEVANLLNLNLDKYKLGSASWKDQFNDALAPPAADAGALAKLSNYLVKPFALLAAFIPPTTFLGGWLCFFVSLIFIGFLTAIIGDIASLFGCAVGLKASITAITVVALGTSLPDTFASVAAAQGDETADNSIGNVTGSNSVNVFLGLGLPWTMAAAYHAANGSEFKVAAGSLGFTVTVFSILAVITLGTVYLRGCLLKGELGDKYQTPTSIFLVILWFVYILLSILYDYEIAFN